jgi:hypothetical protein
MTSPQSFPLLFITWELLTECTLLQHWQVWGKMTSDIHSGLRCQEGWSTLEGFSEMVALLRRQKTMTMNITVNWDIKQNPPLLA